MKRVQERRGLGDKRVQTYWWEGHPEMGAGDEDTKVRQEELQDPWRKWSSSSPGYRVYGGKEVGDVQRRPKIGLGRSGVRGLEEGGL